LAPFESYMLADDTADYPMVFHLRLSFRGLLDRVRFEAALREAAARHPLFQSVVRDVDGEACWVPAEQTTPQLDWAPLETPIDRHAGGRLDITQRIGLRAWVRCGRSETNVLLEFHHCCCDGVGAVRFIEDLLVAYRAATSAGATARYRARALDASLLHG